MNERVIIYIELNVSEHHRTLERLRRAVFHPSLERKQETSQESTDAAPTDGEEKGGAS